MENLIGTIITLRKVDGPNLKMIIMTTKSKFHFIYIISMDEDDEADKNKGNCILIDSLLFHFSSTRPHKTIQSTSSRLSYSCYNEMGSSSQTTWK